MNQQTFEAGVGAYQRGDWAQAASLLERALGEGEVNGRADHLRGNALMKLGRFDDAASAYQDALRDSSYGRSGALHTNMGRALEAAGRLQEAVESLTLATQDPEYQTPYKAYNALGSAYAALGDIRSAGIAFRNSAIDESNPNPSSALRKLGSCFMDLGRPVDAVEAYRTALDFSSPLQSQNNIYCDLALAYVAANRMPEAVDAFEHATADGTLRLTPQAQASYDAARQAVEARQQNAPSDTDNLLAAAGYGPVSVDPLDPTGETTGNLMPSPEDTGFFSVSEEELVRNAKDERRGRRKKRHTGRKVLVTLLVIVLLLAGACGVAYYQGYGWPTQEATVEGLFESKTNQGDVEQYLSPALSDADRANIVALVPSGATDVQVSNLQRGRESSSADVSVTLSDGTPQSYSVQFARDGVSWRVSEFEPTYEVGDTTGTDATDTSTEDTADATSEDSSDDTATADDTSTTSGTVSVPDEQ